MTRAEFLDLLTRLRRASIGRVRAPHKPLLLLWLFGQFAASGTTVTPYSRAEDPVSALINDFGPGALGRNPVGLEAAHVRWHSQAGPDVVANGLSLCALHHALFDLGVLGLTADRRIQVSSLYVARSDAGRRAVDDLADQPLLDPRPGQPAVELVHVDWHCRQVFKGADQAA